MIFAECNYKIYDKKFLIIVKVFKEWRLELKKSRFLVEIITDHKNLKYFIFNKLFNRRQTRWLKFLFQFNFKIIYCFEKQNQAVDVFNRQSKDRLKKKKMWQQILKNDNFEIFIENFKISVMIFRAFDSREINLKIDNEVEKLIETENETVSISRIFISSFDNLILMFKKIVKAARAVHQSVSTEKKKKLNLKK